MRVREILKVRRIGKRFDDTKDWIKAEFGRVDERLDRIDKTLEKLDTHVKVIEARAAHW